MLSVPHAVLGRGRLPQNSGVIAQVLSGGPGRVTATLFAPIIIFPALF